MTQEDKELLLKDLCARLPYVTYYDLSYYGHKTRAVLQEFIPANESLKSFVKVNTIVEPIPYENIKPYLRPMSSMTVEEFKEYHSMLLDVDETGLMQQKLITKIVDWLDHKMFDHRGLIPKSLTLAAPEGMYKEEEQ